MTTEKTILITGATGKQGGAVARHLAGKGFKIRALTRKPTSDAATALAKLGCEIVQGDFDDAPSMNAATKGVWGVWSVQNTWEAGVVKEEEQGKQMAKLARECGVEHFVYTSVGAAHLKTGIPHFDNKFRVEETVRSLGFASHTILRPAFFFENVTSPWFLNGDKLVSALKPDTAVQMISADDIGRIGARAFTNAAEMKNVALDISGDTKTMAEVATILTKALGRTIEYTQIPMDAVRSNSEDMALMLEWFEAKGYVADITALEAKYGKFTKLEEWAATQAK